MFRLSALTGLRSCNLCNSACFIWSTDFIRPRFTPFPSVLTAAVFSWHTTYVTGTCKLCSRKSWVTGWAFTYVLKKRTALTKPPQLLTFLTYLVFEHFTATRKIEAAGFPETSVATSQTGARQSTEDRSLNIYCRHDLLSYSQWFMSQTAPTCDLNTTWHIRTRGCRRRNLLLTLGPGMYRSLGVTIRRHIGYCARVGHKMCLHDVVSAQRVITWKDGICRQAMIICFQRWKEILAATNLKMTLTMQKLW